MWVCVKPNQTKCGWVTAGRVVDDADPMLEDAEPGCWERIVMDGSPVEEATAEPGKVRRTRRVVVDLPIDVDAVVEAAREATKGAR